MLPSEIPKLPQTCQWEGFLVFGNYCFMTPSLGWVSIPNTFVSLFIFYILSYLLSMTMGCLSGCLVFSASVQKLFCGICSAFKWSFDEFVGEKVVSLSYSFTILGPPHSFNLFWCTQFSSLMNIHLFICCSCLMVTLSNLTSWRD